MPREQFVAEAAQLLTAIQVRLFSEAKTRLDSNIRSDITSFDALADYFGTAGDEDDASDFKGWVRASWSSPSGAGLEAIEQRLKRLKLSIRNAPLGQASSSLGKCIFTGEAASQEVLIARAY
jgi:prolyl-tRNA synthetase